MNNNPPEVIINLSRADAEKLVESCEANIMLALMSLQQVKRETAEVLVENNATFTRIVKAVKEGLKP